MSDVLDRTAAAFGLGFALGAAPGPVQLLILTETARGGLAHGLRVMLGANGSLLLVLSALALGISAIQPSDPFLEVLRVLGGTFLIYLAVTELRTLLGSTVAAPADPPRRLGPTARGIVAVVLNPGAWIFFATTASALLAGASTSGGRDAAMASAIAMALGVSVSDFTFTLIGSGGRHVVGDKGLRWIRIALAGLLGALGVWFVLEGLWGL